MNNIPNFSNNLPDRSWPELLAGYVLGDLSSDEMILVQAYLESNPAAIAEVEELKTTLDLLPLGLDDVAVPADIKTNLFAKLGDREKAPTMAVSNPVESLQSKIQQRWFVGIGSIAAIMVAALGLQSYQMQQEFSAMRQELARLRETQEQVIAKSSAGDRYQESVAFMRQSGSRMLTMTGSGLVSGASGNVVIVPEQNRAILTVQKMPQPPVGKVYHLWAVVNNQKVACIQFVPETNGQVLMQIPANRWNSATQVVVTVEPEQSESQPTGEMVMSGDKI
jgi:anti-sigma-K factor RskA